ncbi:DUF6653 family protein [Saccharopolyspora elongata]|uniref:Uncharacterized protein n=1 Tax=Saccharopolyspora elongata TaxID=2530387 RepID=A0A4R4XUU5_9PSEU|nr:DUF6653 family protein [Saccharopolyspora elongata]TDD34934.1 hypothetical protein E1288_43855 [Saccharopolyspora elongata]
MSGAKKVAKRLQMDDESWRRHANPWSVWTRFAAIPFIIGSIWSREWIGWWALVPLALTGVWLWLNVKVFAPIEQPASWAAKGIYGERLWLQEKSLVSREHRAIQRLLIVVGLAGFALTAWGLFVLEIWPTVFGAVLTVLGQLWRIDRFGLLYDELKRAGRIQ